MAAPPLANLLTQTPGLSHLAKFLGGIDGRRPLPRFSGERFYDWFRGRSGMKSRKSALLYPDLYNEAFFPGVLMAAVRRLESWGYAVRIPEDRPPAIRPLLHYGMLDEAKKRLKEIIARLAPELEAGTPIVVLEPSAASVFRDELPELFPGDEDGQRLAKLVVLLSEFMREQGIDPPRLDGRAIFHGHCHQKAVLKVQAARDVLGAMGLEVEEPQPGCCGMAGSFGMERGHYDISLKIGEEKLLPACRKAGGDDFIVADGFSCRSQILDGTGRRALHLAELLEVAEARRR
jgi:Fe-S oxidoreductase